MKFPCHLPVFLVVALGTAARAQTAPTFPRGEAATADNHVGTVWLNELSPADSTFQYSVAQAVFAPAARLDWHLHPDGQVLLFTDGVGYYQERGKPRRTVHKGDVIKCPPGVEHWHGATATSGVTYIAITPTRKGKTVWLKRLTAQEYAGDSQH